MERSGRRQPRRWRSPWPPLPDEGEIAGFSSSGPTPLSLRLKPDVTAPGVGIFSSVPRRDGTWDSFDGTSMAAPHVAGAAAVLRQRHPAWTPAQIKSALALTGTPVTGENGVVPTTRQGGGMIDLEAADNPLVFAAPSGLSFGLLQRGRSVSRSVALTDAGGGAGVWSVEVADQPGGGQAQIAAPPTVSVPGRSRSPRMRQRAREGEATGYVVLRRGDETRRIAYWFRVASFDLARHRHRTLTRTGTYRGTTRGQAALVTRTATRTTHGRPDPGGARRARAGLPGLGAAAGRELRRPDPLALRRG